jgi:hypothetical protein
MFYKNKRKTIKVGYLTASDENILMGGGADLTMNLLRAKIYEPDVKIEDLMEGDVEAILVFLRNTGFGPEMNVTAIDPKTNKSFTTQVMLDELNIIKGQEPNEDGTFITTLPRSNSSVKLKPLTYGEIMELRRFEENYPKGRVVPSITWRLGKEIIELDGETDKGKIAKSLEIMPIADSKYIRNFLNNNEPRLDMTRVVTTPSGEKLTVNVGFGVEFFRPFFGL